MSVVTDEAGSFWYLEGFIDSRRQAWRTVIQTLPMIIGRVAEADLHLFSSGISHRHAELYRRDGRLWIRDLESTNGTRVNLEPVREPTPLTDGDVLHFADLEFRLAVYRPPRTEIMPHTRTLTPDELSAYLRESDAEFDAMLRRRDVYPLFQPVISLSDDTVIGFELLSRGTLQGSETSPAELFSIAERLGRELELSRLFRAKGLIEAAEIRGERLVFVNTHPAELGSQHDLLSSLREDRRQHAAVRLVLEIHEAAVTAPADLRRLRSELRDLDIQIAFDDFGTGRSRLLELADVPPDFVKFDMGFVRDLHLAPAARRKTLASLVKMTRESGIVPIAEGIETEEERRACREMGFDLAQGYLLGLPTPLGRLADFG
jgi:EAL domain-containing protein (putative c-di-GMP-specific phosphodiesterase class I)